MELFNFLAVWMLMVWTQNGVKLLEWVAVLIERNVHVHVHALCVRRAANICLLLI